MNIAGWSLARPRRLALALLRMCCKSGNVQDNGQICSRPKERFRLPEYHQKLRAAGGIPGEDTVYLAAFLGAPRTHTVQADRDRLAAR